MKTGSQPKNGYVSNMFFLGGGILFCDDFHDCFPFQIRVPNDCRDRLRSKLLAAAALPALEGEAEAVHKQRSFMSRSHSSTPLPTFLGEGSPTKRLQKKGTLILTSLLEDLVYYSVSGGLSKWRFDF